MPALKYRRGWISRAQMWRWRRVLPGSPPARSCASAAITGRNGLVVFKASGVSVENLTACNFLSGADTPGDEIWFDGGGSTGTQQIGSWRAAFLSATSSYFGGEDQPFARYGVYVSNTFGPGLFTQVYGVHR